MWKESEDESTNASEDRKTNYKRMATNIRKTTVYNFKVNMRESVMIKCKQRSKQRKMEQKQEQKTKVVKESNLNKHLT